MIRAVIVDDDKETIQIFNELLSSNGIKVVGRGYNGQDAVFLYQKLKPDVIFLDLMMPVYDGIFALEKIRELDKNARTIVIYDKITVSKQVELNRLKPSVILHEPLDVNELLEKTHSICKSNIDSNEELKKNLVNLAIKNTLLELGHDEYDKIVTILKNDFNSSLDDCYEHPEHLKQVLQDLFGESYMDILNSLKENLQNISKHDDNSFIQNLGT